MKKNLCFLLVTLLLGAAGLGLAGCSRSGAEDSAVNKTEPPAVKTETGVTTGKALAVFSLASLNGGKVTVAAAGKPLVINFWATWCPPCREEMPELNRFAAAHKEKVDFWAVNIQEPVSKVSDFMQQNQYTIPVLTDLDGEVAKSFRVTAIPTTVVVDRNGVIRHRKAGAVTASELEAVLKDL
ncbi:MAG TPA: TlpA disulfide reductase family protein [Patescibacteria group bacterium]|nr:TlpA disulfide reductase family protein [Patescibacteria group bacterium]